MTQEQILQEVKEEREHQDKKWGGQNHDDLHDQYAWIAFIVKYLGQAGFSSHDAPFGTNSEQALRSFRYNMIKVAALAIASIEFVDRRLGE